MTLPKLTTTEVKHEAAGCAPQQSPISAPIMALWRATHTLPPPHRVLGLAWPIVVQNLCMYSRVVIATAFVGHLGDPALMSAAVLAMSFFNVTGYSILMGLGGAMDTICGQVSCCRATRAMRPAPMCRGNPRAAPMCHHGFATMRPLVGRCHQARRGALQPDMPNSRVPILTSAAPSLLLVLTCRHSTPFHYSRLRPVCSISGPRHFGQSAT
jgi:hypothetical protein